MYPLRLISKYSYAIYLVHQSVLLINLFGSSQNGYFRVVNELDVTVQ